MRDKTLKEELEQYCFGNSKPNPVELAELIGPHLQPNAVDWEIILSEFLTYFKKETWGEEVLPVDEQILRNFLKQFLSIKKGE